MKLTRLILPVVVAFCVTAAFAAADVSGAWSGPMEGVGDAMFQLKSDSSGISGTMKGPDGKDHPISSGKLEGDKISLTVDSEWQGAPVKLIVTGTVKGDEMQLHIASDNGYWQTDAKVKKAK